MKKIVFFLFFCMSLSGRSQSLDSSFLYVRASAQREAVLLRWAAATPLVWKQTNRCGFRLERYTVVRDKKILDTPERKILGEGIFRPRPLEAWKDRIEENDNAAIVAQALYGEDFQLTGEDSEGLARIVRSWSSVLHFPCMLPIWILRWLVWRVGDGVTPRYVRVSIIFTG